MWDPEHGTRTAGRGGVRTPKIAQKFKVAYKYLQIQNSPGCRWERRMQVGNRVWSWEQNNVIFKFRLNCVHNIPLSLFLSRFCRVEDGISVTLGNDTLGLRVAGERCWRPVAMPLSLLPLLLVKVVLTICLFSLVRQRNLQIFQSNFGRM